MTDKEEVMNFFETLASKEDRELISKALAGVPFPDAVAVGACIRCGTTEPELDENDACKTCGGPCIPHDMCVPKWLVIEAAVRKLSWQGVKLTDSYRHGNVEEWQKRENERRAAQFAIEREKKAKSLARLKAQHVGEKYDRKLKQWVKDPGGCDGEFGHQAEELEERPGVRPGDGQQEA